MHLPTAAWHPAVNQVHLRQQLRLQRYTPVCKSLPRHPNDQSCSCRSCLPLQPATPWPHSLLVLTSGKRSYCRWKSEHQMSSQTRASLSGIAAHCESPDWEVKEPEMAERLRCDLTRALRDSLCTSGQNPCTSSLHVPSQTGSLVRTASKTPHRDDGPHLMSISESQHLLMYQHMHGTRRRQTDLGCSYRIWLYKLVTF